jgi:hypothetical protein
MNRFSDPATARSRQGNGSRQTLVAAVAIAAVLGLSAVATDQYIAVAKRQAANGTYAAAKDDDIYTGSILYMPDAADNVCHQWLFDNQTGDFADNGSVDCNSAAYRGFDGPKRWSAARIKVISDGFRDR